MDVEKFTQNQSISDEEALYGIAKILFADSLKSFKSERNAEGKQDITIEYGGNRAVNGLQIIVIKRLQIIGYRFFRAVNQIVF